ncbi:protein that induces appearance of [PIN+] prion when overproduced [Saxophila tyrrhenica]|uniref:Protein that induces appearance of [PIN+] prion when overproduced n=1 Tax=Saxophila tyrrhenica TaxID=1690608 RepID=A0AAV9P5K6_9PEZI|nr:protein that induces appearance of [PIN+] prion when overproduced [Saxophila tyrrhenica]
MANLEELHQAQVNRSIRTIKAELEFLCDSTIISPSTLSDLLSRIPPQTALHAPISVGAMPPPAQNAGTPFSPLPNNPVPAPLNVNSNRNNEKQQDSYYPSPSPQPQAQQGPPPPAYNSPPPQASWPPLAQATALYAYTSTDAGDLELQPNDNITVTEYMNAEWWKGKSSRTGQEGIFPRSYVKVVEEKSGYGNQPLEVSQMGDGEGKMPGKGQEAGKKFGKKLGNAAIFGAGATIGGNIVNSIF